MKIIQLFCVVLIGAGFISGPVFSQDQEETLQRNSESDTKSSPEASGKAGEKDANQAETEEERKARLKKAFNKGMQDGIHDGMFNNHVKRLKKRNFPINISIPEGAKLLPKDLKIPKGTPLAVCVSENWIEVSSIRENADGSISVVRETLYGSINCKVPRKELIIEDSTIEKIGQDSENDAAEKGVGSVENPDPLDLNNTYKVWTDITGKHKLEAKLVSRTDSEVTLKTKDGRSVTLPFEKLSSEDQKLLSRVKPE